MTASEASTNPDDAINAFEKLEHEFKIFMNAVQSWFLAVPSLAPHVHSVKSRLKNKEHLHEKIVRKAREKGPITADNIFGKITDLAGVRVLLLHQEQFRAVHCAITEKVETKKDWFFPESPKVYTWDPESRAFFESLGIAVEVKESFYTSLHYLVKPREDSPICCEIQVRTLFEEIWGEVDHALNYPTKSTSISCQEQLKVLAKIVGAGSRLVDSIFRTASDGNRP